MNQPLPHHRPGVQFGPDGVRFSAVSQHATEIFLCLFDKGGNRETHRHAMSRAPGSIFTVVLKGIKEGQRYGYRADGPWLPEEGHRFDLAKLLVDPHATLLDRPFRFHADLVKRKIDTHKIVPKAIVERYAEAIVRKVHPLKPGGLIYKLPVKAFSMLNPAIPEELRGTLAAIAHPASIAHFKKIGTSAVELMPVAAWIDERHLMPHHLTNAWGYNPVTFMALEPRIAPGGMADLRKVADALHAEGIALFLDVVYNHSGESDLEGPVLSMRGLDNAMYYRHHADEAGALVNDVGTGNTMAVERGPVRELVMDALRHMVLNGGADGFRFDLCVSLGRTSKGFSPFAPLFEAMRHDPVLSACTMIAEPWDIGPGGYQLGNFPPQFLEWNDRYRDDVRRFWRGDPHTIGALATRLAGSSDFFGHGAAQTRSVNFLAAHDGLTLADVTAYRRKHNYANGEDNRDGHGENFSWNHGVEGDTRAPAIGARRREDVKAMLGLLFLSRGTPMLTAGDEFGRTQHGNNNAYAQDNATTWLDWEKRDADLEDFACELSRLRAKHPALQSVALLTGRAPHDSSLPDVSWFRANGEAMTSRDWEDPANHFLGLALTAPSRRGSGVDRVAIVINRNDGRLAVHLPRPGKGLKWSPALSTRPCAASGTGFDMGAHSVSVFAAVR
jgi:glycogen debranching enzyme